MVDAFFTVKAAGDDLEVNLYWPLEKYNHFSKITFIQYYIQYSSGVFSKTHPSRWGIKLSGED